MLAGLQARLQAQTLHPGIVAHHRAVVPRGESGRAGQRRCVDDRAAAALAGEEGAAVAHDEAPLGVRVGHLHGEPRVHLDDVVGAVGARADAVLGEAQRGEQRRAELEGRVARGQGAEQGEGPEDPRRAGHIVLHQPPAVALQAQPAGVVHDALTCPTKASGRKGAWQINEENNAA